MNHYQGNKLPRWKLLRSEPGPDMRVFTVRYDWMENPRNGSPVKATILEAPDWVNIVAVTPEDTIVVVDQYRFGTGNVTTEIPAGLINEGEDPEEAARRELKEETGYTSSQWIYLGWVEPNPAFLNNRCHQWLARDVRLTDPRDLDDGEDIAVRILSLNQIRREIRQGTFRNSLALLALSQALNLWDLSTDIICYNYY